MLSTMKKIETLQKEYDQVSNHCVIYEDHLKLQESSNLDTSKEVKSLKEVAIYKLVEKLAYYLVTGSFSSVSL